MSLQALPLRGARGWRPTRDRNERKASLALFILAEIPHGGRPSDSPSVQEPMDDGV
jgi:hypothetical protein